MTSSSVVSTRAYAGWGALLGFVEVRNAIQHGLGRLTDRQLGKHKQLTLAYIAAAKVRLNTAEGCQRVYDLFLSAATERPTPWDEELLPRFAGLRDAAAENDPLLASDLDDIIQSENATGVSNATGVIMRRCVSAGHITQSQIDTWLSAAR